MALLTTQHRYQLTSVLYLNPFNPLSVRPSVRPSVCLSVRPSVRLSVCPSVRKNNCWARRLQNIGNLLLNFIRDSPADPPSTIHLRCQGLLQTNPGSRGLFDHLLGVHPSAVLPRPPQPAPGYLRRSRRPPTPLSSEPPEQFVLFRYGENIQVICY